ncbi:MAG: helix-turn-helix transcriptional regulator [Ruminococcaceae bacterium]|nr:helix-turn-helix transcriptional regulator [Oscillospiraceae bacterium]
MFIQRLLNLINEKGISRKQFSEDVQINKNQLKRWEDVGTIPNRTTLIVIAQYFNVSVEYLLGETDERLQKEKSPAGAGLKEKHWRLITAYERAEGPIKEAVDRLLNIEDKPVLVKIAARDGSFQEREITQEEWEKIKNLPDADL